MSEQVYSDLPAATDANSRHGEGTIFITGRFRSGSTLLWNLFRHVPGCTSYYEPLNERRWFDPARRGTHVDQTHKQVENYWREYGVLTELIPLYREEWTRRALWMPPGHWDPALKRYIEILIERAPGRAVLQFNRVDFRLPWLRGRFPAARLVHLYRHPRDQWVSTLHGDSRFPPSGAIGEFAPFDMFYLLPWARDLAIHFPFLDERQVEHPYELFYLIWKLSYLFGRQYADVSLEFEQLVAQPRSELSHLFDVLGLDTDVDDTLLSLIERPKLGRWRDYADAAWFSKLEAKCERTLAEFFASSRAAQPADV